MRYLLVAAFFVFLMACFEPKPVEIYQVPKQVQKPTKKQSQFSWQEPADWQPKPPSKMRLASFVVPGEQGFADASIVVLAGSAGGMAANVNRWRGQINLPAQSESQIKAAANKVNSSNGSFFWFELIHAKKHAQAIYAAILTRGEQTVFVKLSGPQATLAANKNKFLELCRSIK